MASWPLQVNWCCLCLVPLAEIEQGCQPLSMAVVPQWLWCSQWLWCPSWKPACGKSLLPAGQSLQGLLGHPQTGWHHYWFWLGENVGRNVIEERVLRIRLHLDWFQSQSALFLPCQYPSLDTFSYTAAAAYMLAALPPEHSELNGMAAFYDYCQAGGVYFGIGEHLVPFPHSGCSTL